MVINEKKKNRRVATIEPAEMEPITSTKNDKRYNLQLQQTPCDGVY